MKVIKKKKYFEELLNVELPRETVDRDEWNLGMEYYIKEEEVPIECCQKNLKKWYDQQIYGK